jgi:hypothetical protein
MPKILNLIKYLTQLYIFSRDPLGSGKRKAPHQDCIVLQYENRDLTFFHKVITAEGDNCDEQKYVKGNLLTSMQVNNHLQVP